MPEKQENILVDPKLHEALEKEIEKFQSCYYWLEESMPQLFFEEMAQENIFLIAQSLISFALQQHFCIITIKRAAIVLCLDSPDADLRILKNFGTYGIQNYQCYISSKPLPNESAPTYLRVAMINFTAAAVEVEEKSYPIESKKQLRDMLQERNPSYSDAEFEKLISSISSTFLRVLPLDRITLALEMFLRAKTRDNCQYEVYYNNDWQATDSASMQIVLAWRNTPKYNFLYQIAEVINRYNLAIKKVTATYIDPYSKDSILIMALDIHGNNGKAAWEVADIPDVLRSITTAKYFAENDSIEQLLVSKSIISISNGNLLRSMADFIQQLLVHMDQNLYTVEKIKADLCRHPELTVQLCEAFTLKFHPKLHKKEALEKTYREFDENVEKLDTGNEDNDNRRKNVLRQGMSFIKHILKTNFFRMNYTALSFRLDPAFLDTIPFDRTKKFPELPYAVFFIRGMHFFGFHIRFKDLARGGIRTVYLEQLEHIQQESNNVFNECYNLALTQHMKNKDIPEGGSKGVIFLSPRDRLDSETAILQNELSEAGHDEKDIQVMLANFRKEQKQEYLYQAQRSYIESLITIVNCDAEGKIKAKYVLDYWNRPEYLYLGPDENMHDSMITWIAEFSKRYGYKPAGSLISSKPNEGINHKEFGVTSLGLNVYLDAVLRYMGIDPTKERFTVKMSGGPDGDVAGNQILNLARYYPKTAKLLALTDGSGSIFDPNGLNLQILVGLFNEGKGIRFYPAEQLSNEGFLLDKQTKRVQKTFAQQTLCWKKNNDILSEEWLSSSEMNLILRSNVHQTIADVFIPAGGRPRTLNETNVDEFLDQTGKPTAKAIVEGANLYLTPKARRALEKLGVIIIKDSSANKGGVICSSFEVLCGLALGDELFLNHKEILVEEILERIKQCSHNEAQLLLQTHKETGEFLTDISARISERINLYTYQILDYLDSIPLRNDPKDSLIKCFFSYCLPTLRENFQQQLLDEIPEHHKKAIIACHLAARLVYRKGIAWQPTIVDILPVIL